MSVIIFALLLPSSVILLFFVALQSLQRREWPFQRILKQRRATRMPAEYLKPEPRKLRGVGLNETTSTDWSNITVDRRGRAFVDLSNSSKESKEGDWHTVEVRRELHGFVVKLPASGTLPKFTPHPLLSIVRYEPVLRIDVAEKVVSKEAERHEQL
jgi:hypothetical protein